MSAVEGKAHFLYEKIESDLKRRIQSGALRPGDKLPSLRLMSRQAGVSIATVMQAYANLEISGLVAAREKSGYFVKPARTERAKLPRRQTASNVPRPVRVEDMLARIQAAVSSPDVVSLGVANPWPEMLPVKGLAAATARVLSRNREVALGYCFAPGSLELRNQIAYRLGDCGVVASADEIAITNGATEALTLALSSVAERGDVIAVESPCYHSVLQIVEHLGMLALEIPVAPDTGLDVDALREAMQKVPVKAVLCVPNFSNPTGALMPDTAKAALVELLSHYEIPLIEDDVYGELYFGPRRPTLAKSFDTDGWVISCSSFSKSMAPGYRVGWVLGGRFAESIKQAQLATSWANTSVTQLAVAEFLRSGGFDRFLRRVRKQYEQQLDRLRELIAEHFPATTRMTCPRGGFVLWLELPARSDSEALFREGLSNGVSVIPGTLFSPTRKYRNYVRIACGRPLDDEVEQAVATFGQLVHASIRR